MRWRWTIVLVAASAAWVPTPARLVERWYSNGFYAAIQRPVTSFSNYFPVAAFDLLLLLVLGTWVALLAVDLFGRRRRGPLRVLTRVVWRTVVLAAALYVVFLVVWGLNYRRVPLVERLAFDRHAATPEAARSLAETAVAQLNTLYAPAHAAGWPLPGRIDPPLASALERVHHQMGGRGEVTVGRPKRTLLDWYFRRTAVDGMTDPYLLETLVSTDLLPFERPFVMAHEWSHLAGLADEGEANFLGWLACVQSSPPAQYSGWLFLYGEVAGGIGGASRTALASRLEAGPRSDLAAIRARLLAHVSPRLSQAGWRVYDEYLKANRVEAGAASYAQVVQLILGVRFAPGWIPQPARP
jgi:hypothetical protein